MNVWQFTGNFLIKLTVLLNTASYVIYFIPFYLYFKMCYSYLYVRNGEGKKDEKPLHNQGGGRFVTGWIIHRWRKTVLVCDLMEYRDCKCGKGKNKICSLSQPNLQHSVPMAGCGTWIKNMQLLCRNVGSICQFGNCIYLFLVSFKCLKRCVSFLTHVKVPKVASVVKWILQFNFKILPLGYASF